MRIIIGDSGRAPHPCNRMAAADAAASWATAISRNHDVLRKEAVCTTELDYTEQTSWLLFLKYLDGLEQDRADEAELSGKKYAFMLERPYRGESWTAPKDKDGKLDHNKHDY